MRNKPLFQTVGTRLIAPVVMLISTTAIAAPLTPSAALAAARSQAQTQSMRVAAKPMELVYSVTSPDSGLPAVYLFAGNDGGFIVASADDTFTPLLGYSPDSSLDVDNLPPSFLWWLDGYAAKVAQSASIAAQGLIPAAGPTALKLPGSGPAPVVARTVSRASIDPIVQTKWNQDSPFNDQCPAINGTHTYTGCVATATAQIMNVHQWPVTGSGSKSYTFQYNSTDYTDSFDFGSTTFDWASMLNTYSASSSTASKSAVATLMHAVGVAAEMNYGLEGSGAQSLKAAIGLVQYLGYDPAMTCLDRNWFTQEDWNDMVYAELAAGRPVYYGGDDGTSGHAFVCDGYSSDERFHINWGWGGSADGYFLLYALSPTSQGIGGGTGADGFNYNQDAFFGMQKDEGTSAVTPVMALYTDITTGSTSYTRNSSTKVKINGSIYSFSTSTTTFSIGLCLVDNSGNENYLNYGSIELAPYQGISGLSITSTSLPTGEYDVYMCYSGPDEVWHRAYYEIGQITPSFHMVVTSSEITIGDSSDPDDPTEATLSATLSSWAPVNGTDAAFYPGHDYLMTFNLTTTGAYSTDLFCLLYTTDGSIISYTDKELTYTGAGTYSETWTLSVPESLTPGEYRMGLYEYDGENLSYVIAYVFNVVELNLYCDLAGVDGTEGETGWWPGHTYNVSYHLTAPADWTNDVYCVIMKQTTSGYDFLVVSDPVTATFTEAATQDYNWTVALPADFATGDYVLALIYSDSGNLKIIPSTTDISVVEAPAVPAGEFSWVKIDGIERDGSETVQLEMSGAEIEVGLKCITGPWTATVAASFADEDDTVVKTLTASPLTLDTDETGSATLSLRNGDIPAGKTLYMTLSNDGEAFTAPVVPVYMQDPTAIEAVSAAAGAGAAVYYNLQGIRVERPSAGWYLRVTGNKVEKIKLK